MFSTLILLLSVAVVTANLWNGSNLCDGITNCKCDENRKFVDLQCTDELNRNVLISICKDTNFVTVKCDRSAELDLKKFHKLPNELNRILNIKFVNCSIPANDTFSSILQRFGVRSLSHLRTLTLRNSQKTKLHQNVFQNLPNLLDLDLSDNKFNFLLGKLFINQTKLVSLNLDNNPLEVLTKDTFTGLSSLKYLYIKKSNYKLLKEEVFHDIPNVTFIALGNINDTYKIPDNIFATNKYLDTVYLERVIISKGLKLGSIKTLSIEESEFEDFSNNSLTNIIAPSISGSRDITNLSLSRNQFTDLYDGLFDGFTQLLSLRLSYNNLTTISGLIFQDLHNLEELHLAHNHLQTIHQEAFTNTKHLKLIDLSNNQLSFKDSRSLFMYLVNLERVNLSNNNLTAVPSDLINIKKLRRLNLAFNNISTFKYMDFSHKLPKLKIDYEPEIKNNMTDLAFATNFLHVYLNDNLMECDCSMHEFLRQKTVLPNQLLKAMAYICSKPMTSKRFPHNRCHSSNFRQLPFKCPDKCEFLINLTNKSNQRISINCTDRGLTTIPEIPSIENRPYTLELYLNNNSLTELPKLQHNLHVIIIQASYNRIFEIREENLPPNLRALDVSHNNIKTISYNVYKAIKIHRSLEIVFMADNPWYCDCTDDTRALIEFVKRNISLTDLQEATCHVGLISSGTYKLSSGNVALLDDLCFQAAVSLGSIVLAVLAFLIGIFVFLFYKYQQLLKVWLYAHHACLWFIDEEELDKDKQFDAFISYSHKDRDFAVKLMFELQKDPNDPEFKICLHERNWLGGQYIADAIVESVNDSRRTIVILSKNYLQSQWCLEGFRRANEKSMNEKRNHIIVIRYGYDIEKIDAVNPMIQPYLKTRTYIEWGEPWFWKKLRYALPHRK